MYQDQIYKKKMLKLENRTHLYYVDTTDQKLQAMTEVYSPHSLETKLLFHNLEEAIMQGGDIEGLLIQRGVKEELQPLVEQISELLAIAKFQKHIWLNQEEAHRFIKGTGITIDAYMECCQMRMLLDMIRSSDVDEEALEQVDTYNAVSFLMYGSSKNRNNSQDGNQTLYLDCIDTPIGTLIMIADHDQLYLLEFLGRRGLKCAIQKISRLVSSQIKVGQTKITEQVKEDMSQYFIGKRNHFITNVHLMGTEFQNRVWEALCSIPYGTTISYATLAQNIHKPTAHRAVANANGKNQLAIIVPCHRVIQSNGSLGGYGGGIARKSWMLEHEIKYR